MHSPRFGSGMGPPPRRRHLSHGTRPAALAAFTVPKLLSFPASDGGASVTLEQFGAWKTRPSPTRGPAPRTTLTFDGPAACPNARFFARSAKHTQHGPLPARSAASTDPYLIRRCGDILAAQRHLWSW